MPQQTAQVVDHLFRNEFGKAVAYLTSQFGPSHLEAAEDAVQEALIQAMKSWPFGEIPRNPSGWIIRVATNKLIDHLRRQQKVYYAPQIPEATTETPEISEELFKDEMVKMMFACCNPSLSAEYQLILTLKILGGLSVREIASALLKKEETVAKSYTRAKKKFRESNLSIDIPSEQEISNRLQIVLRVIYLLFNEGYKTTEGEFLIRRDLCDEAMRLTQMLLEKPETNNEFSRSLMALMLFQVSRFDARIKADGEPVSLEDQDRSLWKQEEITLGNRYLTTINDGMNNEYFIQAAINGIHCAAKNWNETSWTNILILYNHLHNLSPSPIIALNRIYPYSKVHGAEKGLNKLHSLADTIKEDHSQLFFANKAELLRTLGKKKEANEALDIAISKTNNKYEKQFLSLKKSDLEC